MTYITLNKQMQEGQYCSAMTKCDNMNSPYTKDFMDKINKAAKEYANAVVGIYLEDDCPVGTIKANCELWISDEKTVVKGATDYLDKKDKNMFMSLDKNGYDVCAVMLDMVKSHMEQLTEALECGYNISDEFKERIYMAAEEYVDEKTGELREEGWSQNAIEAFWCQDEWKHEECVIDYLEDEDKAMFNEYMVHKDFCLMDITHDIMDDQIENLIFENHQNAA